MANNPKKVKDPTEVALSAIQEALNISDTDRRSQPEFDRQRRCAAHHAVRSPGLLRNAVRHAPERRPPGSSIRSTSRARPAAPPMTIAKPSARSCRRSRRAAPPAASIRLPPCSPAVWMVGCGLLTVSFLPVAAGRDRTERRRAGARRPCGAVLCAGAAVLFPRKPCLARPGNAHDRAIDGAGRDPLLRARRLLPATRWSPSVRRSAARSRRWATASNARSRAPANWKPWSPTKSQRWSAPIATTKCASARCCRTSPISATIWSARPSRFAAPFPACRSTCATTSR